MDKVRYEKISKIISNLFVDVDAKDIKENISGGNFSYFNDVAKFENIAEFSDFWDDLYWFAEIKDEPSCEEHPCIHMSHACSTAGGKIVSKVNGLYSISDARSGGTVISNCPWCGIHLNTEAL
ncbi:hypothetical protein [Pararhizobium gei]|uniref:hypothetical protein n=1 Tax=Pararhizobium gei TaxID=1395951 RepID=UPI0023DAC442|nr:hypothetical protein [Rhizobium gei]